MNIIQSVVVARIAAVLSSILLLIGCADSTSVELGENIRPLWVLETSQQTKAIRISGRVADAISGNNFIRNEFETLIQGQELASLYSASDPLRNDPFDVGFENGVRLVNGDRMRAIYGNGAHQLWRRESLFNYRTAFALNESLSELELRLEFAGQRLDTISSRVNIIDLSDFTLTENGTTPGPTDFINLSWNIGDVVTTEPATLVQHLRVSLEQCDSGPIAAEVIFIAVSSDARSAALSVSDFPSPDTAIGNNPVDTCQYEIQVIVASIPNILFADAEQNTGQIDESSTNPVIANLVRSLSIGMQVTYGVQ